MINHLPDIIAAIAAIVTFVVMFVSGIRWIGREIDETIRRKKLEAYHEQCELDMLREGVAGALRHLRGPTG